MFVQKETDSNKPKFESCLAIYGNSNWVWINLSESDQLESHETKMKVNIGYPRCDLTLTHCHQDNKLESRSTSFVQ